MSALRPQAPDVRFQVLVQIAEALGLAGHPAERQQALEMAFGEASSDDERAVAKKRLAPS